MMSAAFDPASRIQSDPWGSIDTRLDLVPRAQELGSRMKVRVLIANQQPIVRHGLRTSSPTSLIWR